MFIMKLAKKGKNIVNAFYVLKVLTNEKRGGLKVVAFDRSFKQTSAGPFLWEALNFSVNPVSIIWNQ